MSRGGWKDVKVDESMMLKAGQFADLVLMFCLFFFFQAEDGIRDRFT